jgi:hypothetical protein
MRERRSTCGHRDHPAACQGTTCLPPADENALLELVATEGNRLSVETRAPEEGPLTTVGVEFTAFSYPASVSVTVVADRDNWPHALHSPSR